MKKVIFLIVFLQVVSMISAQDLTISFQPKVNDTPIDSIHVTNLRTNQFVKLLGGESLLLVKVPTGINSLQEIPETGYIYPNPSNEDANFCFSTDKSQEVEISMYTINGQLLKQNRLFLEQGIHRFELKFPDAGIYYISVLKREGTASFKAVYTGSKIQNNSISYEGSEKLISHYPDKLKGATTDKTLNYTDGDFIQYSVSSGVNTTILTETPTVSKAFDVEFVNCVDNDGKSYKVVKIDNQWWMAENLAYLPAVSPPTETSYTLPYYYVYGYTGMEVNSAKATDFYSTYGALYNWSATKEACPPGWHLPTDNEWKQLEINLGMPQVQVDATGWRGTDQDIQMKATNGWTNDMNGTNTSGFSALPGGYRSYDGAFTNVGNYDFWWSSSEDGTRNAWYRGISYTLNGLGRLNGDKKYGFSIRCIRDLEF